MKKVAISCMVLASVVLAQNVKQKPPLGPVVAHNAMIYPKGKFGLVLKSVFLDKEKTYDGDGKIFDPQKRSIKVRKHNLVARYGLGYGLDLRVIIPLVDKSMHMYNPKMKSDGKFENTGLGDTRVLLKYKLTDQKNAPFFSVIEIGAELPTGKSSKNFSFDNGKILPNKKPDSMQLGDGSVDFLMALRGTKLHNKHRFDVSFSYNLNTKGSNGFKAGSKFLYDLGYSYNLHKYFMPTFELNGEVSGRSEKDGKIVNSSGGHELYFTPGFASNITKNLKLFAGFGMPVYQNLNHGALGGKQKLVTKLVYVW